MPKRLLPLAALLLPLAPLAAAPKPGFTEGPVFTTFAPVAAVKSDLPIPPGTVLKVAFGVSAKATPGELNHSIETAARFVNMHAAAGVPRENIHVAVVVYGPASPDVLKPAAYAARNAGAANGSAAAIGEMMAKGVDIILCGQSAAGAGIDKADVLPGVKLSLSAMTAFALLQQQGYSVNPF